MRALQQEKGTSVVVSFKNHPTSVTHPLNVTPTLFPWHQKVNALKKEKMSALFLLEFTEELRRQSADDFLSLLFNQCPFDHLVLGPNASIGKDREGNSERLMLLSKKYGFTFHQVEFDRFQGQVISSTLIRKLIQKGDFDQARQCLNKPYALQLHPVSGMEQGRAMGFPTLNFELTGLVYPPLGVYEVKVKIEDHLVKGVANLGYAPTVKQLTAPLLEVHLLEPFDEKKANVVEITFVQYLREEMKFHSLDELKAQIQKDIDLVTRSDS